MNLLIVRFLLGYAVVFSLLDTIGGVESGWYSAHASDLTSPAVALSILGGLVVIWFIGFVYSKIMGVRCE